MEIKKQCFDSLINFMEDCPAQLWNQITIFRPGLLWKEAMVLGAKTITIGSPWVGNNVIDKKMFELIRFC